MSSIIAILGVGLIAQWSILSNLTASVILFFNHPMRIGDRIRVIEKDYNFVEEVKDITGFFVFIRIDNGENITLSTSFVFQRGREILEKNNKISKVKLKRISFVALSIIKDIKFIRPSLKKQNPQSNCGFYIVKDQK